MVWSSFFCSFGGVGEHYSLEIQLNQQYKYHRGSREVYDGKSSIHGESEIQQYHSWWNSWLAPFDLLHLSFPLFILIGFVEYILGCGDLVTEFILQREIVDFWMLGESSDIGLLLESGSVV